MDLRVRGPVDVPAGAHGEAVDFALGDEGRVRADPGVHGVEVFEGVLLLVLPFHVFLLVADGVPPDVEEAVGPCAAVDEEGAEVEAAAVLGDDEVDGVVSAVSCG